MPEMDVRRRHALKEVVIHRIRLAAGSDEIFDEFLTAVENSPEIVAGNIGKEFISRVLDAETMRRVLSVD